MSHFMTKMLFEMWLIKRTHLKLIVTLTSLRMVRQPATKCVPLVVCPIVIYTSIILIPIKTTEWVLFLTLPFETPANPLAIEIIFYLTSESCHPTFEYLLIFIPQIPVVFGIRAILT